MWPIARVWILLGGFLSVTFALALDHLWLAAFVPVLVWGFAGLWMLAISLWQLREPDGRVSLWQARHTHERRGPVQRIIVILACFVLFVPLVEFGAGVSEYARFKWMRPKYERIVDSLRSAPPKGSFRSEVEGVQYVVDAGPPFRVAFVWPGGLLDNWCGIVHDSSGGVLEVNALPVFTEAWRLSRVTKLFGGDMTSCREVETEFFLCCFT